MPDQTRPELEDDFQLQLDNALKFRFLNGKSEFCQLIFGSLSGINVIQDG